MMPRLELDDVTREIITHLQGNGRMPNAELGRLVGLSEAAVRKRVKSLIERGIVQIVAVTDPLELGFGREAMIGIRIRGAVDPVVDALVVIDEVDYVVVTTGRFDLIVEAVAEDDEHLFELIHHRIRTIEGVESTETFPYVRTHKQTYSWRLPV